jgi:hypothetical protein
MAASGAMIGALLLLAEKSSRFCEAFDPFSRPLLSFAITQMTIPSIPRQMGIPEREIMTNSLEK